MSDPAPPGSPPPAALTADASAAPPAAHPYVKPNINQRIAKWLPICAGLIAAVVGAAKISENFMLPSCGSSRSLGAIKSIFSDKNLPEPTLTGATGVSSGASSEKACQARYEIPNESGTLDYKVFWEGWEPKVMITKVSN
jgi:hypothetical protein